MMKDLIRAVMPNAKPVAVDLYAPLLETACARFGIDSPARLAMFLAQIAHESGELRYVREIASGEDYEGRADLGNTEPGDGKRFKGRGLIQITGRYNYEKAGKALGLDLISSPELLEQPENAAKSAAWWWFANGLNGLCEPPGDEALVRCTRRINGGTNGLESRRTYYRKALGVLFPAEVPQQGISSPGTPPPLDLPPDLFDQPETETQMPTPLAVAQAVVPLLWDLLPWKKPETKAAMDKATPILLDAVAAVTGSQSPAVGVEQVLASPEKQKAFVAEVAVKWGDIAPFVEATEKSVKEARTFAETMTGSGPMWRQIGYALLMAILAIGIVIGGGAVMAYMLVGTDLDPSQKAQVLDYYKALGYIVAGFVFGSSYTSRQTGQQLADIAKAR